MTSLSLLEERSPDIPFQELYSLLQLGPFSRRLQQFSHPESHDIKLSNVMVTELFYSHNLQMNTSSLHTKSFRRI